MGSCDASAFLVSPDFYLPLPPPWDCIVAVVWDDYPDYVQREIRCFEILVRQAHGRHLRLLLRIREAHLARRCRGMMFRMAGCGSQKQSPGRFTSFCDRVRLGARP